jgi:acetyl-CoA carboxylase biotin carboxyl carrier protein
MPIRIEAQIAGSIWKIEKAVGDPIAEEEVILIIESMKMEIPVEAPCAGRVAEICVVEGDAIEEGVVLAIIE